VDEIEEDTPVGKKGHTEEQILRALRRAEGGTRVADICREHGATRPNEKWSMDFVAARLIDGRWFRVLTVVDQFTRECLLLLADSSLTGQKVALALSQVIAARGAPVSITVDNGTEFASKAMDV